MEEPWFGVIAVDSLEGGDGTDASAIRDICRLCGVPVRAFRTCTSYCRRGLEYVVNVRLPAFAAARRVLPVLHIVSHSYREPTGPALGLSLADGEQVSWEQLGELLSQTAKDLDGNLLLCIASCEGFDAARDVLSAAPLINIVAAEPAIYPREAQIGFGAFYSVLNATDGDIVQAHGAMNLTVRKNPDGSEKFRVVWDTEEDGRNRLVRETLEKYLGLVACDVMKQRLLSLFPTPWDSECVEEV